MWEAASAISYLLLLQLNLYFKKLSSGIKYQGNHREVNFLRGSEADCLSLLKAGLSPSCESLEIFLIYVLF